MNDKRWRERTPVTIPGFLVSDRLHVACTILDLSKTGARLQIEPGLFLPKQFILRAPDIGGDRVVDIVWRNRTQLGTRFAKASVV